MKNKLLNEKSSQKVANFLNDNNLHKKDFAEMIGVTLSYVYNLIDETIPFSSRSTTLERIATVMEVNPEDFEEYRIPQEPETLNESVEFIKNAMKKNNISVVEFLKLFPRKQRMMVVDMLRGVNPIPVDLLELRNIGKILDLNSDEIYYLWEFRMRDILYNNGMDLVKNSQLLDKLFDCAKEFIKNGEK